MNMTAAPELLTVKEAAARLRVSERTIQRYIERDRLPYIQHGSGSAILIRADDLLATKRASERLDGE